MVTSMLDKLLSGIEKPGRYIGNEINAHLKSFDESRVRFVLAFPDVYEIGLSHLGVKLLYHELNRDEQVMADRVYAPWVDFESRLRISREPLRGIESGRALCDFDFVGFSLQYELSYTNILTILDLGRIPLLSKSRGIDDPWVIAGGPCAFNPEPLADFFDFVVLGEAEQVLLEVSRVFLDWKKSRGARSEFMEEIRRIDGIYVPSFFDVSYHGNGTVSGIEPLYDDYAVVKKRLIPDLDKDSCIPEQPIVPLLEIVHNRLGLEIARGCTRGCRFCQAGFIYRPVRERHPQTLMEQAEKALSSTGFEEISLLSLSTGDYCQIQSLVAGIIDHFVPKKVAVSLPSMRVGTLTPELMEQVKRVRKTGFTLAPEAGSERLRRVINKGILDEDLLSTAKSAFHFGWRLLKLYFMMGLPTETPADLDALVNLCSRVWKLAKHSKSSVNVSVSTFVPKAHTPFQWVPQLPRRIIEDSLSEMKRRFNRPGLKFKWNDPSLSILEAACARGDRRLGKILLRAWELGARFDGWSDVFNEAVWKRAFNEAGLDPSFYAERQRSRDEILPWDHLSAGVEKEYLWKEYERALAEEYTSDCRWNSCSACGVCDHKTVRPRLHHIDRETASSGTVTFQGKTEEHFVYWFRYAKLGKMRFFGQLEIARSIARALRRAALPVAFTKGFHPHPKLSFDGALPLGFESLAEEAYLTLTERLNPDSIRSRLNRQLPGGLKVEAVAWALSSPAQSSARRSTYRVSALNPWTVRCIIQSWRQCLKTPIVKKTKRSSVEAELGDILLDIRQVNESSLEMDLYEGAQACFRPALILHCLVGETVEGFSECRVCKMKMSRIEGLEVKKDVCRAHHQ